MENIGTKIRNLRAENDLTLQELGDKVGVQASTVRKWETGFIKSMGFDKIQKLADALGTTPAYLMGETSNTNLNIRNIESNNGLIGQNSGSLHITSAQSLTKEEQELLRIFNSLDVKRRIKLMSLAYELEEDVT